MSLIRLRNRSCADDGSRQVRARGGEGLDKDAKVRQYHALSHQHQQVRHREVLVEPRTIGGPETLPTVSRVLVVAARLFRTAPAREL